MKGKKNEQKQQARYEPELMSVRNTDREVWKIRIVGAGFYPIAPYATRAEAQANCDILNAGEPESKNGKPAPMARATATSKLLRVEFTPEELTEKAHAMATAIQNLAQIDDDRKTASAEFSARMKEVKGKIDKLSNEITRKHRMEDVDCEWYLNCPTEGMKVLVRLDTHETIDTRLMIPSDFQLTLADVCKDADKTTSEKTVTPIAPENPAADDLPEGHGEDKE